jgi:hypothetical protein
MPDSLLQPGSDSVGASGDIPKYAFVSESATSFPPSDKFTEENIGYVRDVGPVYHLGSIASGSAMSMQSWLDLTHKDKSFRMRYLVGDGPVVFKSIMKWITKEGTPPMRFAEASCTGRDQNGTRPSFHVYLFFSLKGFVTILFGSKEGHAEKEFTEQGRLSMEETYKGSRHNNLAICYEVIAAVLDGVCSLEPGQEDRDESFVGLAWMTPTDVANYKELIQKLILAALRDMEMKEQEEAVKGGEGDDVGKEAKEDSEEGHSVKSIDVTAQ